MSAIFSPVIDLLRRRPLVCGAILLAVVLGISNYFLWKTRGVAARENDEMRRKGESMLRALANREKIETDIAALKSAIAYLEKNLLDEQSMEVNLGYFYKLEKPARVRIIRLNQLAPPPLNDKKIFKAVPFSLQVSGPYRNVMSFVRALETGSRIIRIRSCSFEHTSSDASEYVLDLTVEALSKMNPACPKTTIRFAVLLAFALTGPCVTHAAPSSATIQQRIDALLKHRLKPEPLPVTPPNPFQMTGAAKRESNGGSEEISARTPVREDVPAVGASAPAEGVSKEPVANASEILDHLREPLKLGGVIILKEQIQIVVNGVPRKEGDTVAADWNNTIVYLKIAKLLPGQLVLRYGESEATLKF